MKREPVTPMRVRLLKAVAVVLAILVVAPGVEVVARIVVPSQIAETAYAGIDASTLLAGGDPYASLDRIEEALAADSADVPTWFSEEIGFLPGARDIRVSGGGPVVGYVVSGEARETFARLVERMESAGWTSVPLGEVDGATFVKPSGSCTWALATCTQIGSETSVVVRCKLP